MMLTFLRKIFLHQAILAQLVSASSAVIVIAILSRYLTSQDYAHYAVVTAIWAIGNAVVGTGIGTRIARVAAEGGREISLKSSEILVAGLVSAGCGAYVVFLRASITDGALAAVCMMTFILAEATISFEIGARRFGRYLFLLAVRVVSPVFVLLAGMLLDFRSVTLAFVGILIGNLFSIIPSLTLWSFKTYSGPSYSSFLVGYLNLGLWVVASADRIILELLVRPSELALYALTYGLMDKLFRALSNAYIARSLGTSFSKSHSIPPLKYFAISFILYLAIVPCGVWAVRLISGGRYSPDFLLTGLIAGAGLVMLWSAPFYVALLASAQYRGSLLVIGSIALFNMVANFYLDALYGIKVAALVSVVSYIMWLVWLVMRANRLTAVSR